jgi:AcrR family transcriptional regulator
MEKHQKEKILETARVIFTRFGIKKSTMDEIAKKIRMGKSTLYHYFKSKEDIFLAVVKRESDTLKKNLQEVLEKKDSPKDKFRNYVKTRMKYLKELSVYYATLTDAYFDIYSFAEEIREDFQNFELESLKSIFTEGVEKEVFDLKNPELTAKMIIIAFKGFEYLLITKEETPDVESEFDMFIDMFFEGILKH